MNFQLVCVLVLAGWVAAGAQTGSRAAAEASVRSTMERYLAALRQGDPAEEFEVRQFHGEACADQGLFTEPVGQFPRAVAVPAVDRRNGGERG